MATRGWIASTSAPGPIPAEHCSSMPGVAASAPGPWRTPPSRCGPGANPGTTACTLPSPMATATWPSPSPAASTGITGAGSWGIPAFATPGSGTGARMARRASPQALPASISASCASPATPPPCAPAPALPTTGPTPAASPPHCRWPPSRATRSRRPAALARDLPAGASLAGTLASGFQLAGPLDALDGELSLTSSGLRLGYQPPEDVEALDVPAELNARATLAKGAARARLAFTLPTLGALNGEVGIDRLAADGQLQGALRGQFTTLTWLDGFFPELDNLDGRLALDLALAGQPAAPRVAGSVAVDGLEAQVPVAGIQLADGRARLTIDGDGQWQLAGGVTGLGAEGGEAGALEFDGAGLRDTGTLALRGEDVLAVDRPDARVRLSPDLRL